jgi:alkanesulfonate monooxygenase SsuD/methylene tetrahydromethanopterin reductase-like flavin-dependent oxidoreductase (luciferase family)
VHDVTDLEARGVPSVYVATEAFVDGAERQAKALGFDPAVVFVSHPIQDRTDDEMRAIAEHAFAAIVAGIVKT